MVNLLRPKVVKTTGFSNKARLQHILDAICEIENYIRNIIIKKFSGSSEKKYASVKQLEIIGEVAGKMTGETKSRHPEVEWTKIIALRNILVHDYYVIDENVVWNIITEDLPELKEQIVSLLKSFVE